METRADTPRGDVPGAAPGAVIEAALEALLAIPRTTLATVGIQAGAGYTVSWWVPGAHTPNQGKLTSDNGIYGQAARLGQDMVLARVADSLRRPTATLELPGGPCAVLPFPAQDGTDGGFVAIHREPGLAYAEAELEQARAICRLVQSSCRMFQDAQVSKQQVRYLRAMTEVARVLTAAVDVKAVLALVVDVAMTLSPADACWLFLAGAQDRRPRLVAARGVPRHALGDLRPGTGYGTGIFHQIPINPDGEQVGFLGLTAPDMLMNWEQEALWALGHMAGLALRHLRMEQEQERLFDEAIMALVAALEARDPYTRGHSVRVGEYAAWLGQALGMNPADVRRLRIGGYLHDIGKIGIPESVLLKPGRYTPEEFAVMQQHPVIGHRILSHMGSLTALLPLVRSHHERLDGNGYPDGLVADQIEQPVRIMAIADVFEALVSDRPYRRGMRPEEAFSVLEEGAGRLFDRDLVNLFIQTVRSRIALGLFPPQVIPILQPDVWPDARSEAAESGAAPVPAMRLAPSPEPIRVTRPAADTGSAPQPRMTPLSKREREILALLAQGLSNQQMATRLDLSLGTVKSHVSRILHKLGLHDRSKAAVYAAAHLQSASR